MKRLEGDITCVLCVVEWLQGEDLDKLADDTGSIGGLREELSPYRVARSVVAVSVS